MAKTRRELIDCVISKLGVLVPGQSPGDEVVSKVDSRIDPTVAMLIGIGIEIANIDVGTPNPPAGGQIDDVDFLSIADSVAWQSGGDFNMADAPSLKTLADEAEARLRIIHRPASTRQTLRADLQLRGSQFRAPIGNFTRGT